ncbi:MAG: bifunctional folylpolyglutamate synthase/dihydrofolate synthase [Bacteroidia bacterium]|nr:bifunctional folylpolyglutamate synthase/dihydrofolate synthase [Bacteroidia bacterium]
MNYQDTINWMFSQLPMYQNQGKTAYKEDIGNTIKLVEHLKNPHKKFKSIHVAGTNGKGSTSHMLASILQEAGYKVGLYTSPHLKDFRERIKINGKEVSKQFVIGFIKRNKTFFESNSLSFFEMTVGMAFDYFAKQKVDIAIIEVGLGGRLDSTNVITPLVSVITNIGLDHTQFLGNTLEQIATEKGGIIKPNVPVVIGETQKETRSIFLNLAKQNGSEICFADDQVQEFFNCKLKGNYQKKNINTALQTIKLLANKDLEITSKHKQNGLLNVVKNTGLLGRWQILQEGPRIICDAAHNKEGLTLALNQLKQEQYKNLHIVIGFVKDKDLERIIEMFPRDADYYFCKPDIERGLDANTLRQKFIDLGYRGKSFNSVNEALQKAKKSAKTNDLIYVGGSTFVVAEIL